MHKPKIIVISGPSGAGKTTLLKRVFLKKTIQSSFVKSISCTTRAKRPGEREGKDYYFLSRQEFVRKKNNNFFLEYQKVLDDYYGTPRCFYTQAARAGKDLILCIDVKGGVYLKKHFSKYTVTAVFISAPHKRELCRRLKNRDEPKLNIKKRVALAKKELRFIKKYDYLIINQDLQYALKLLESVLIAERVRRS